jgi:hypothetical protein
MSKMLVKRVMRHAGDQLEPGERVVEVAKVLPHGGGVVETRANVGGAVGSGLGRWLSKKQAEDTPVEGEAEQGQSGDASRWPLLRRALLTLTDRRLVLFDVKGVNDKPGTIRAEFGLDRIAGMSAEAKRNVYEVRVSFADGSAITIETARLAPPGPLIDAFEQAKGA